MVFFLTRLAGGIKMNKAAISVTTLFISEDQVIFLEKQSDGSACHQFAAAAGFTSLDSASFFLPTALVSSSSRTRLV